MTAFRQWAKAWTGVLVLLLAVVFVGSAYHGHQADRSSAQGIVAVGASDLKDVGSHGDDGSPDKGDRHDKSTCQACTVAAQLIALPTVMLLTIAASSRDSYQLVDVERAGRDPPGLDRPPILSFA